MIISFLSAHETVLYAAEELQSALRAVGGIDASLHPGGFCPSGVRLGLLEELGRSASDVSDPVTEDVVDIEIRGGEGFIAGSNPRSVLIGVYEWLKSMGCRWLCPGDKGAYLPKRDVTRSDFSLRKKADFRFRGECIEGAVSFENVRDTIRWLPKVGMNMFMMEQIVPYNYMSRWYKHQSSTVKKEEPVTFGDVAGMIPVLEKEIKRCGLQLHALGHGYLLEPYGIHYRTGKDRYELSDEAKNDVALVNGARGLYHGSPNFTQLCMSRPEVRAKAVDFLTGYVKKKPHIDFLHVWLADAVNNHCECEECQKFHPSDLYVKLLNELDEKMTSEGIDTRVVFIMYTDTLWAPLKERFKNSSRFVFTCAVSVSDLALCKDPGKLPYRPVWERNRLKLNFSSGEAARFYCDWRKVFGGPAFAFEYYFYTDHFNDPGAVQTARNIFSDVKLLRESGLDGIMSDQTQRCAFPNAFALSVLGEALFDSSLDFDKFEKEYYTAAYGEDAGAVKEYLSEMTSLFCPDALRERAQSVTEADTGIGSTKAVTGWKNDPSAAARLEKIPEKVKERAALFARRAADPDPARKYMGKLLAIHGEYCRLLSGVLLPAAQGDNAGSRERLAEMTDRLSRIEDEIQPVFDLVLFCQEFSRKLK
ncbi:MAG: DUF4838 domain-containing protein [Clostridia bacterium]|nr:DUF4838 domain-containing protein [Clostridia bacterium]